jgi:hypothetical protein
LTGAFMMNSLLAQRRKLLGLTDGILWRFRCTRRLVVMYRLDA